MKRKGGEQRQREEGDEQRRSRILGLRKGAKGVEARLAIIIHDI